MQLNLFPVPAPYGIDLQKLHPILAGHVTSLHKAAAITNWWSSSTVYRSL